MLDLISTLLMLGTSMFHRHILFKLENGEVKQVLRINGHFLLLIEIKSSTFHMLKYRYTEVINTNADYLCSWRGPVRRTDDCGGQ